MIESIATRWTAFWFTPSPLTKLTAIRRGLAIVTAIYFVSAMGDVATWFARDAPASSTNLAAFFRTAELTGDARWMVSPLFIWDSVFGGSSLGESTLVYRGYLLLGVLLAILVGFADQLHRIGFPDRLLRVLCGNWSSVVLWVWFVGWANRVVLLAGIVEPVLSVSLAALAIAPMNHRDDTREEAATASWRTTLAARLLAVQATLIGILTTATMLASPTWWNGTGAYALVAPTEDRLFDATGTLLENTFVYESATFLIVGLLPLGLFLAWRATSRRLGIVLIWIWCVLVGLLSANILYAATLGIIASSIDSEDGIDDTDGADSL